MAEALRLEGRVLVVDDDRDFAAFYVDLLEGQGLGVDVARTVDGLRRRLTTDPIAA